MGRASLRRTSLRHCAMGAAARSGCDPDGLLTHRTYQRTKRRESLSASSRSGESRAIRRTRYRDAALSAAVLPAWQEVRASATSKGEPVGRWFSGVLLACAVALF